MSGGRGKHRSPVPGKIRRPPSKTKLVHQAAANAAAASIAAAQPPAASAAATASGDGASTSDLLASRIRGLGPDGAAAATATATATAGAGAGAGAGASNAGEGGDGGSRGSGSPSASGSFGSGGGSGTAGSGSGRGGEDSSDGAATASPRKDLGLGIDSEGFSATKRARFARVLGVPNVNLAALRKLAWGGVPSATRPAAWKLLLGVVPTHQARQATVIERKRAEYSGFVRQYFGEDAATFRTEKDKQTLRDVSVDVPRTCPTLPLFHTPFMQQSLERVLFVWAMRHPASGYVQGINDIVTPFYTVLFQEHGVLLDAVDVESKTSKGDDDEEDCRLTDEALGLDSDTLMLIEADVYWCLAKLLDDYQDHYTFSQPGIQRMVFRVQELVHRLDEKLAKHIESLEVQWMHLLFRWMNCLLLRELPHRLVLRLWDTLLCEEDGFEAFHVYVCVTLLVSFSDHIQRLSNTELLMFSQAIPEKLATWTVADVESLLGKAYINKTLFESAPRHLQH